jgi:formate dehydrogenase iron-sulfur subunit
LYFSSVPFEKLGFPDVGTKAYPSLSKVAIHSVPPAVLALGALLGGAYAFLKRRAFAIANGPGAVPANAASPHQEFEPLRQKLLTPFNWILMGLS